MQAIEIGLLFELHRRETDQRQWGGIGFKNHHFTRRGKENVAKGGVGVRIGGLQIVKEKLEGPQRRLSGPPRAPPSAGRMGQSAFIKQAQAETMARRAPLSR